MIYNKSNHSRIILLCSVLLIIAIFAGCKTLLFRSVFGNVTKVESSDDYEGYWQSDDGFIGVIKVLSDSSKLVMAGIDWNEKEEKFVVSSEEAIISRMDDATFFNFKLDNNYYRVQQFELRRSGITDETQLLIWDPDIDEFERLVTENKLPGKIITKTNPEGKVETDSVIVDNLTEDLLVPLLEKNNLFKYKDVQILRRIMKPLKK